jgi:hypothetical protein
MQMTDAFFTPLGDHRYLPSPHAEGPWSKGVCHGGPPLALAAHELVRALQDTPDFRLASIHLDLLGEVPIAPLEFRTTTLRPGRRIRLVATEATDPQGRAVLAARAWAMTTHADRVPSVPTPFEVPAPDEGSADEDISSFAYGRAIEWRFVSGGFATPGPAVVWASPRIPLLADVPLDPLAAALLVADSANGTSSVLDFRSYLFVPTVVECALHRAPTSTHVGMSSRTTIGADGVGTTYAMLFDHEGVFGQLLQALYVDRRD